MSYLEARLAADTGTTAPPVVARRAAPAAPLTFGPGPRVLEVWFSYRSPYSYLAIAQLAPIVDEFGLALRLRPVLPLVERGAQMPSVKRMYLARDAHREAVRLGIPFGRIADPLGAAARNAIAITRVAASHGRGLAFASSAMRGIWAEARDLSDYVDLRAVVERADLSGERYKDIADALAVPIGTVMSRLFRARRQLEVELTDYAAKDWGLRKAA